MTLGLDCDNSKMLGKGTTEIAGSDLKDGVFLIGSVMEV